MEPPLLIIVGPTASGKSDLAMSIAAELAVEIVAADSRQVYRGMDVGTAKPGGEARARVQHHLIDLLHPDQPFSVARWLSTAREVIPQIWARGHLPLVVGGTGLYVSALVDGYDLTSAPPFPALRHELNRLLSEEGIQSLRARLTVVAPEASISVDPHNPRRIMRAIERAAAPSAVNRPWRSEVVMVGLDRPRAILDARIDARASGMFENGLVEEVSALLGSGYSARLSPMTGHGYAEAAHYLAGEWSLEQAIAITAQRTRQYARRQLTWFKRDPRISWLDLGDGPADSRQVVSRVLGMAPRVALGQDQRPPKIGLTGRPSD